MPLPPWVIDELNEDRARREEEERVRSRRIELPQTSHEDGELPADRGAGAVPARPAAVVVVDISPADDNVFDL
jgi:hypothetical protein